jgi:Arc/MetJ-type ribon-helix-helix transcriptional regulator
MTIRLSPKLRKSVDAWAVAQPDNPSRSEAIRRLLEVALAAAAAAKGGDMTARAARAEKMAGEQIDRMLQQSDQPEAVKAKRKKRLTKGPAEFR